MSERLSTAEAIEKLTAIKAVGALPMVELFRALTMQTQHYSDMTIELL